MTNAVVYARISSDPLGRREGVERQDVACQKLAAQRGWTVVDTIVENDTSAAGKVARPGFDRMLQAVESGRATVVVAWNLDRLTRNRRDTLRMVELFERCRTTIALVQGSDLDLSTTSGRLAIDMLAAVARAEIDTKSERQREANEQKVSRGERTGGRRPFGYDRTGRALTINDDEAAAIRDGYRWLLEGVAIAEIARRWNARGLRTPQNTRGTATPNPWTGQVITRCLRKPMYAGLVTYQGERVPVAASWPAIVDSDTWHAAQGILSDPDRRKPHGRQQLLTGVARCGLCGATVHAGGGRTGLGVYRCSGPVSHLTRRRDHIDRWVNTVMINFLADPRNAEVWAETSGPNTEQLLAELNVINKNLASLARLMTDGVLSELQVRSESKRLKKRAGEINDDLNHADPAIGAARAVADADDVGEAWMGLDTDLRREVIDRLVTVTIHGPGRGVRSFNPDTVTVERR